MALAVLLIPGVVARVAMPSLAALLIVVGIDAVKPARIASVVRTVALQATIVAVTFVLTLIVPLQFAVLTGVGLGIILFVAQQSNRLRLTQIVYEPDGRRKTKAPDSVVGAERVIVLQPYGSLFFASAPIFELQLPAIDAAPDAPSLFSGCAVLTSSVWPWSTSCVAMPANFQFRTAGSGL